MSKDPKPSPIDVEELFDHYTQQHYQIPNGFQVARVIAEMAERLDAAEAKIEVMGRKSKAESGKGI